MKEGKAWVEVGGEFPYKELPLCQAELTGQGGLGRSPSRQQGSIPNPYMVMLELLGWVKATKGKVTGQSERQGFSSV